MCVLACLFERVRAHFFVFRSCNNDKGTMSEDSSRKILMQKKPIFFVNLELVSSRLVTKSTKFCVFVCVCVCVRARAPMFLNRLFVFSSSKNGKKTNSKIKM